MIDAGAGAVVGLWSLTETDRTMLLIFSTGDKISTEAADTTQILELTNVEHIPPAACVEMKRCITCWAVLRLEFANELIEACLM